MKKILCVSLLTMFCWGCREKTLSGEWATLSVTKATQDGVLDILVFGNDDVLVDRLQSSADGSFSIKKSTTGKIFVAQNIDLSSIQNVQQLSSTLVTPVEAFYASKLEDVSRVMSYGTKITLAKGSATVNLTVEKDVVVESCEVRNVAKSTTIVGATPNEVEYENLEFDATSFSELTSVKPLKGWLNLYQSEQQTLFTFVVSQNGNHAQVYALLPKIERNRNYNLNIGGAGVIVTTNIGIDNWGSGSNDQAANEIFVIDTELSSMPSSIKVLNNGTWVEIPSGEHQATIVIRSKAPLTANVNDRNVAISKLQSTSESDGTYLNSFHLTVTQKGVNMLATYPEICFFDEEQNVEYQSRIVLELKENRTQFVLNKPATISGCSVVFDSYVDGSVVAISSQNEIETVTSSSVDNQYNWTVIDDVTDGGAVIEGVFKPNDSDATGQEQVSEVEVRYKDGVVETYYINRPRESIPSVFFAGRHWAKYNCLGDNKKYADQIGFSQDKADVWTFLKTCSAEEYFYYSGQSYVGLNTALNLEWDAANGRYYYEGFKANQTPVYQSKVDAVCPSGYVMPTETEYAVFLGTGNLTFPVVEVGVDQSTISQATIQGKRYTYERFNRGSESFKGSTTANVYVFKVTDELNNSWVMSGYGTQNQSINMFAHLLILTNKSNNTNNYSHALDHSGNRTRLQTYYNNNTRILRCLKESVKYVIE